MTDTQWPRWEVLQQEQEGQSFRNTGAVHAPDAEMALQNARDVFVRRPACVGLCVVPESAILACTAEELAASPPWQDAESGDAGVSETYYVCEKRSQRAASTFVTLAGQVKASSPVDALRRAVEMWPGAFVWWVFPARAITCSEPEDGASLFRPATTKFYRMPASYRTVTQMHRIKKSEGEDEG